MVVVRNRVGGSSLKSTQTNIFIVTLNILAWLSHLLFHGALFSIVIWYTGEHQMFVQLHSGEPLPVVAQWHMLYPQVINVAALTTDHF